MIIWLVLTVMVALAVSGLTYALVRPRGGGRSRATPISILTAQLGEVDAQFGAGDFPATEAEPLKIEIRRRILAEGREPDQTARPFANRHLPYLALGISGVVALTATGFYALLGRPDLAGSPPRETTSRQDLMENAVHPGGDVSGMIAQLEAKMRQTPNDAEGWRMLGWSYLAVGRAKAAVTAYAHAVALDPGNADYRSAEGEALVRAEDGQVTPSALNAFRAAIKDDPNDPRAQYYLALYKDQSGDHAGAMNDWVALIKSAPADAPWLPDVRRFVENMARERGVNLASELAPERARASVAPAVTAPASPTADQVEAANKMSAGDRETMIYSMVDRLANELKTNPRNLDGWEMLIRARMVLGDGAAAAAAYQSGRQAFSDAPEIRSKLDAAAHTLGVPGA